ncbi:hypothetical protein ANTPLA_LOCUS7785 [Anthophora plagiata]
MDLQTEECLLSCLKSGYTVESGIPSTATSEPAQLRFFCFSSEVGWWVALALRAIEQRGYRAWLKPANPPSLRALATPVATVRATKARRVD